MIKMHVIGNLGKDCNVNTVNGKNVINFTVAHTEKFRDSQGNNQERTTWVDCAYWTEKTGVAPYLLKGQQVYVDGTPEVKSFQRSDGTPGASLSLRVREIQLLGGKKNDNQPGDYGNSNANATTRQETPAHVNEDVSDDLPF